RSSNSAPSSAPSNILLSKLLYQTTPIRRKAANVKYTEGKNHFFLKILVHLFLDPFGNSFIFYHLIPIVNRLFYFYTYNRKNFIKIRILKDERETKTNRNVN